MTSTRVVMVIDDDEDLRETMREFLEGDGYRTICSSDGASALAKLHEQSEEPAVILLDLMMPGMNGWQFREEQLRSPQLAHIPVVVMTASRDASGIDANEIVYKPVKLSRLLEIVRRYAADDDPDDPTGGSGSSSEAGSSGGKRDPLARSSRAPDDARQRLQLEGCSRPLLPCLRPSTPASYAPAPGMALGGYAADAR